MRRLRKFFAGAGAANEQLTAVLATLLLPLLAIEGATLLRISTACRTRCPVSGASTQASRGE